MLEEALRKLGLKGHEALVYISAVQKQEQTGYEIANDTGIARANVYAALSSLLEKGYVYKVTDTPARYSAAAPAELCRKVISSMESAGQVLIENLKEQEVHEDSVISLNGESIILDKALYLISNAVSTIYIDASASDLLNLSLQLENASKRGVKVVIISLGNYHLTGTMIYRNISPASWIVTEGRPLSLIIDSTLMLSGELGRGKASRGIYSRNKTLVLMAKNSFIREIILAEVRAEFEEQLNSKFGRDFDLIKEKVSNKSRKDESGGIQG